MPTFALNFSRPGAQVILQYYQFLRLGKEGYRLVQQTCQDVAVHVARALQGTAQKVELNVEGDPVDPVDVGRRENASVVDDDLLRRDRDAAQRFDAPAHARDRHVGAT